SVYYEGRRFEGCGGGVVLFTGELFRVVGPGYLEARDVAAVDLGEWGVLATAGVVAVVGPFLGGGRGGQDQETGQCCRSHAGHYATNRGWFQARTQICGGRIYTV